MKPILFNTQMVQAILAGKKTVTRRVAKGGSCPYQSDDDILWVRETWLHNVDGYYYKADAINYDSEYKWKPSIFMPKKACRLFLRAKSFDMQWLHEITTEDIIKEGIHENKYKGEEWFKIDYQAVWDEINAKRGYPFVSDPLVWRIEFEICSDERKYEYCCESRMCKLF